MISYAKLVLAEGEILINPASALFIDELQRLIVLYNKNAVGIFPEGVWRYCYIVNGGSDVSDADTEFIPKIEG